MSGSDLSKQIEQLTGLMAKERKDAMKRFGSEDRTTKDFEDWIQAQEKELKDLEDQMTKDRQALEKLESNMKRLEDRSKQLEVKSNLLEDKYDNDKMGEGLDEVNERIRSLTAQLMPTHIRVLLNRARTGLSQICGHRDQAELCEAINASSQPGASDSFPQRLVNYVEERRDKDSKEPISAEAITYIAESKVPMREEGDGQAHKASREQIRDALDEYTRIWAIDRLVLDEIFEFASSQGLL